jgi:hypothetical protein
MRSTSPRGGGDPSYFLQEFLGDKESVLRLGVCKPIETTSTSASPLEGSTSWQEERQSSSSEPDCPPADGITGGTPAVVRTCNPVTGSHIHKDHGFPLRVGNF